ncbi:MAG: universal stress protein [Halobacteriota archaeon]
MVILVAIDENERSKRALRVGVDLARTYGDTLIALHVIPTEEYESHRRSIEAIPELADVTITQKVGSAKTIAETMVRETIEDLEGVQFEPRGRVGDVAEEILDAVAEIDPRYLVMSGRRRSPTGKAIFGSISQTVLLNVDCPVVTTLQER